jgi:hypothetical protein
MNDHFLESLAREKAAEWTAEADRAALSRLVRRPPRGPRSGRAAVVRNLIRTLMSLVGRAAGSHARRLDRREAESRHGG